MIKFLQKHHQNWVIFSLAHYQRFLNISLKSIHRQAGRPPGVYHTTSLSEVIKDFYLLQLSMRVLTVSEQQLFNICSFSHSSSAAAWVYLASKGCKSLTSCGQRWNCSPPYQPAFACIQAGGEASFIRVTLFTAGFSLSNEIILYPLSFTWSHCLAFVSVTFSLPHSNVSFVLLFQQQWTLTIVCFLVEKKKKQMQMRSCYGYFWILREDSWQHSKEICFPCLVV